MRHRLICGLVAGGAALALATEALSPFHAVARLPLALFWCAAAACAVWRRPRLPLKAFHRPACVFEWAFELALAAGLAAIGLITAFTAIVSPPNSVDAFGYHLARVVYWAQAGSVAFFPTHYFNQLSMPPFAEYAMLHSYVLTGSDRFVNLVQWAGFAGSVVGVSLIAGLLGAGRRGQLLAAVFCATLPNAVLQASGAKNDCVLALWLAAMVYFALRFGGKPDRAGAIWTGLALGLALLTKATAFVFAPALLAGVAAARVRSFPRAIGWIAAGVLLLNGPQWWRNFDLSGSILGFTSAQADGKYRWTNERVGLRTTASNLLRNTSQQLGARSAEWNRHVYEGVLTVDRALGIDANDPATTWPGTRFAPPVNSNHEADAPNRWHLALLALALMPLLRRARRPALAYYGGVALAFALFCAALKYQPYFSRVLLPLFVLAAPVAGLVAESLHPAVLQAALCLLLFDQVRHPLFENWTRPLTGPSSLLRTARADNYFRDTGQFGVAGVDYRRAADMVATTGCPVVGIDNQRFQLEYPLQELLRRRNAQVRFVHAGVTNVSARYGAAAPCAVVCLGCAGVQEKIAQYAAWGEPAVVNRFLIYRRRE